MKTKKTFIKELKEEDEVLVSKNESYKLIDFFIKLVELLIYPTSVSHHSYLFGFRVKVDRSPLMPHSSTNFFIRRPTRSSDL